jgi:hypothetical protein
LNKFLIDIHPVPPLSPLCCLFSPLFNSVAKILLRYKIYCGPGLRSRKSDSLRAGLSGHRIAVGVRFSAPVQTGPGVHPQWVPGLFPRGKRPGRGADHPPSSTEVEERVELYLYSPFGPSWPVLGRTLSLYKNTRGAFAPLVPLPSKLGLCLDKYYVNIHTEV